MDLSSLSSLVHSPILLTGIFRNILTQHFQEGMVVPPELRHLIWKPDISTTILIETNTRWKPETAGLRPAIVIKRNACRNQRVSIGDRLHGSLSPAGDPGFTTFWVGSHTLFCIGSSGAQAELLASEVKDEISKFAPVLLDPLHLRRLQVTEIGETTELKEATENFVVPVTAGYEFEDRWTIKAQAPPLRLSLSLMLDQ